VVVVEDVVVDVVVVVVVVVLAVVPKVPETPVPLPVIVPVASVVPLVVPLVVAVVPAGGARPEVSMRVGTAGEEELRAFTPPPPAPRGDLAPGFGDPVGVFDAFDAFDPSLGKLVSLDVGSDEVDFSRREIRREDIILKGVRKRKENRKNQKINKNQKKSKKMEKNQKKSKNKK
jgi:hypothetical protein